MLSRCALQGAGAAWAKPMRALLLRCASPPALPLRLPAAGLQQQRRHKRQGTCGERRRKPGRSIPLQDLMGSVVKVYNTLSPPNYLVPWTRKSQEVATGSGFVVDDKRRLLITNAHVIMDSALIEVRREGSSDKYVASLCYVSVDCDLALLTVDDPVFWQDMQPLLFFLHGCHSSLGDLSAAIDSVGPFDGIPDIQQPVSVIGYPMGGDQVSVTSGVVSRIDTQACAVSVHTYLMSIQIDAAVNPGNSGGPAVSAGRVIGVAFQALTQAENISYLIPVPVIAQFLRQYFRVTKGPVAEAAAAAGEEGNPVDSETALLPSELPMTDHTLYHPGFCTFGVYCEDAVNIHLRTALKIPEGVTGVAVRSVPDKSPVKKHVRVNDVLSEVEGLPIGNDGTVKFGQRRIFFTHLVNMKGYGEEIRVTLYRGGVQHKIVFGAEVCPLLVQSHLYNAYFQQKPKYVVFGGLVFTPLTVPYLRAMEAPPSYLSHLTYCDEPSSNCSEVVVLEQILTHTENQGYNHNDFTRRVVTRVNGEPVASLADLEARLAALPADTYVTFSLGQVKELQSLVLHVGRAREAEASISERFGIPMGSGSATHTPTLCPV